MGLIERLSNMEFAMKRVILAATLALIAATGSANAQTKRIAIASFGEQT